MASNDPLTVVITGATAGVGRAVTRAYARRGAKIGLIARDQERLRQTRDEVEALGGQAMMFSLDVADADMLDEAARTIEAELGEIDVWINNAMTGVFGQLHQIEPHEYRRVTEVVYHGQVWGTMAALHRMRPRNRGTIVLVGSALAYRGIPLQSAYCGAKHAVLGMFESVRAELLHEDSDVHLCMVQLPAMNTPQFDWVRNKTPQRTQPVPPIFQPEIAADAILYAVDHRKREMFVGRSTYKAIWGNKVAPRVVDHYLAATGFQSQHIDEDEPQRPDNLFEPVPGSFGAHGDFDDRARSRSPALWAAKHPVGLTMGVLGGLAAIALLGRSLSA